MQDLNNFIENFFNTMYNEYGIYVLTIVLGLILFAAKLIILYFRSMKAVFVSNSSRMKNVINESMKYSLRNIVSQYHLDYVKNNMERTTDNITKRVNICIQALNKHTDLCNATSISTYETLQKLKVSHNEKIEKLVLIQTKFKNISLKVQSDELNEIANLINSLEEDLNKEAKRLIELYEKYTETAENTKRIGHIKKICKI